MKKNMNENFEKLEGRIFDTLYTTDLEKINYELARINGPTLVSGVGGSSVVAQFASKVLMRKNHIIAIPSEPRDFCYIDTTLYENVLACSYSGDNYGVELAFANTLKHYLLASKERDDSNVINLTYKCFDKEHSFISLAATLIPISIILNYFLDGQKERIIDCLENYRYDFDTDCDVFEIFSGIESSTASKYLESTMVESGIGIPIVHDKYSFCHGRSTMAKYYNNIAIYFNNDTELDKILLEELPKHYKNVIVIKCGTSPLSEYISLVKCMYLTKYIAESKNMDLSGVDYNSIVKKLYKYNGNL